MEQLPQPSNGFTNIKRFYVNPTVIVSTTAFSKEAGGEGLLPIRKEPKCFECINYTFSDFTRNDYIVTVD